MIITLEFMAQHLTGSLLMCPPTDFCFNPQTAKDNSFQHQPDDASSVNELAKQEYQKMRDNLRNHGIEIIELEKQDNCLTPDAVFPNNWFITTPSGEVMVFPMKTTNRQQEVRLSQLEQTLVQQGFSIQQIVDLRRADINQYQQILEGTGAVVFDHINKLAYAALSERCQPELLSRLCQKLDYEVCAFHTQSKDGTPIYHTNVMMSVGEDFAVVCFDVVCDTDKAILAASLVNKTVISISERQLEQMCGNILQVRNDQGQPLIIMSESAHNGFTADQLNLLAKHGKLVANDIKTIERVGGGSCRCMLAEIFLPRLK